VTDDDNTHIIQRVEISYADNSRISLAFDNYWPIIIVILSWPSQRRVQDSLYGAQQIDKSTERIR
jgi:hypothetical protein